MPEFFHFPLPIAHVQFMQSSMYLAQLQEQFGRIEKEIESGKTVTLNLTDNDRAISLRVSRDKVVEAAAPIELTASRKAPSLADNNRLTALATNTFTFDLGEANRQIEPAHLRAQTSKAAKKADASAEHQTRLDPGVPTPAVSFIGSEWLVVDDFKYAANGGFAITAKRGFKTDLASVPRLFWGFIASFELSLAGPIYHDLIYRSGGRVVLPDGEVSPADKVFAREEADDLFLELMTRNRIAYWKRNVAYLAVRWFGESSWQNRSTE
jgi:uncharacterized protein DUF1353